MISRCKTYEFSKNGLQLAKLDTLKVKNNRVMDILTYGLLLGLTISNIMRNETLVKIMACDGTKRIIKTFIIH